MGHARSVAGGFQAIEELAREAADVVVTDLRMPEMTGAELLSQVRQLYPGTVRIVLSGQASRESVLQSVRVAHRQLSKPCDAETLKFNINQASQLRRPAQEHPPDAVGDAPGIRPQPPGDLRSDRG